LGRSHRRRAEDGKLAVIRGKAPLPLAIIGILTKAGKEREPRESIRGEEKVRGKRAEGQENTLRSKKHR